MIYDFDKLIDRRHSGSYKWDSEHASLGEDTLPLWVADMDFEVLPAIRQAMQKRLDHGVFGYTQVPAEYYEVVSRWFAKHHGWADMCRSNMIYTTGVVPAISAILQALKRCTPATKCLLMAPVYNCFYSSVANSGYELIESELIDNEGHYDICWTDLAAKMAEADVLVLCNPHNPVGRIWTADELLRIATMAAEHHVFVISDEIHCEFVFPGQQSYTPFALMAKQVMADDQYAICTSCSKAFNVAGLQMANIYAPAESVRTIIDKQININEICDVNPFAPVAMMAAYSDEGKEWIDQLNAYFYRNYQLVISEFAKMPGFRVTRMEGTYLAWVSCEATGKTAKEWCDEWAARHHVLFNEGAMYGQAGRYYIRINMACPTSVLREAFRRIQSSF